MSRRFLDGKVTLHGGDSREVLATLETASVDSVVCDPPYALTEVPHVKSDGFGGARSEERKAARRGFMGKAWDVGDTAFAAEFWAQVLRVLKPGGHLVAFSGTRTYHRLACAIEDAGFEIRDQLAWAYGSGFPKSLDVSKAIDKAAGAEREVVGSTVYETWDITAPATAVARQWSGWGTALKPAWEPIVLARKPRIGTVAQNVTTHGTGALNIDGCRIGNDQITIRGGGGGDGTGWGLKREINAERTGRFPANLLHDGSEEVVALFPESGDNWRADKGTGLGFSGANGERGAAGHSDSGSAARFFYSPKADSSDRLGSRHPTVKPVDLMQWLVRLVTPKGGTCLDPFAGTGTTGEACWREGMRAILIEREEEYQADIARRLELADRPDKRQAVAATKNQLHDPNTLPLFGGLAEAAE
jgi:DNA modification methylase